MSLVEHPAEGDGTLISFFATMADEVGDGGREMLNHIAQALMERGWLPGVDALIEQLSEVRKESQTRAFLDDLVRRRLITLDETATKVVTFLGSVSVTRTPHKVRFEEGSEIYFLGGLDLLVAGPLFGSTVVATTCCPHSGEEIQLELSPDAISRTSPHGIAGFQVAWDGKSDLGEVFRQSHLFIDDAALDAWTAAHPDVEGLPLSADLLLFVGMGMAAESGNARYKLIGM